MAGGIAFALLNSVRTDCPALPSPTYVNARIDPLLVTPDEL